jgi:hypothetical protein
MALTWTSADAYIKQQTKRGLEQEKVDRLRMDRLSDISTYLIQNKIKKDLARKEILRLAKDLPGGKITYAEVERLIYRTYTTEWRF